jgi:uncharacterized membrane protein
MSIPLWAALVAGGSLAIAGLARRSKSGVALAAAGGLLALAGTRSNSAQQNGPATTSIILNTTPKEAYRLWQDFESFPLFMDHIESVKKIGDRTYRWIAVGPMGTKIRWDAEVINEREGEFIAWRSLPGSDVDVNARVVFREAPANRGTILEASVEYRPPSRAATAAARFLNKTVAFVLRNDLRRAKALIETGEIPTTIGQTHGPRGVAIGVLRTMDPSRPPRGDFEFNEIIEARRKVS